MTTFKQVNNIDNTYSVKIEPVAAYVRVSTQEQKLHGLSLDAQKMRLTEYAEKNNMHIVEWYVDEGVSGRKLIRNRPELQRMIKNAPTGNFKRILFIKLDRFFRSVAEYHECMKQISPVIWTATEESYDLSTANGRMLVNMKLTIAELEADQTGERIKIVNEYKVQTGQPLVGNPSLPFGFMIAMNEVTGRKKIVKDPAKEHIVMDILQHLTTHQSRRKTLVYLYSKYKIQMTYSVLTRLAKNTLLYGAYRGNPDYCEAYIDKTTFDKLQNILHRNVKENTTQNRAYYFTGLILCPACGCKLKGNLFITKTTNGERRYKKYRCAKCNTNHACTFNKVVNEIVLERLMLANIEKYLEEAKIRAVAVKEAKTVQNPKYDIEGIHERIDRLNYSWQTGKIRKVEQYEKDYAELMELLEKAETERGMVAIKDYSHVEAILQEGWKEIYNNLDDEHKRAFWRSFVQSIEINWTTEKKEITRVNFF